MSLYDTMNDVDARHLTKGVALSMSGVTKRFASGTVALSDVDFDIAEGEFVAVVGPSGCGKSTLLRMAAGLERPTEGSVALATDAVGFIFQDPTLLPWRSVRANVELCAEIAGLPTAQRRARAQAAIDAVGPSGFESPPPPSGSAIRRPLHRVRRADLRHPARRMMTTATETSAITARRAETPAARRDSAPLPTARHRRVKAVLRYGLPPILSFTVGIAAWYAVTYLILAEHRRFLLPPPHEVLTDSLLDPAHVGPMLEALAVTAKVCLVGFVFAAAIGVTIGVVMSRGSFLERAIDPWAVVLQVIPVLAIVPLIGLWFGYGMVARTIVCVIIAIFPIIANTHFGLVSVDKASHELFTLAKASPLQRLMKLEFPSTLPSMMTGFRTASGLVVVGAIIGDMFFAKGQPGIGTLLDIYRARLHSDDLIAAIILASIFGIAVFGIFSVLNALVNRHR